MASVASQEGTGRYGLRLRRDRLAAGLTQEELAERAGLSVRAISDLERGRTEAPRPSTLRRIAEVLSAAGGRGAVDDARAGVAGLAQLPADVADFCGRHQELEWLTGVINRPADAVTVAVLTGAGGIGKTALALHAAHCTAALFPDGQLYLNLQGSGPQPVPPVEALARFLRDLGTAPADIPAEDDERAARYRSLTSGLRLIIVLDDATDAAQVRPLIPGGRSTVIVTSRNSLPDIEAARALDLGALREPDAAALFTWIAGPRRAAAEPDAVRAVLAACGGLPLAIRIAAARLAARPSWTIAALAQRLGDERSRLDELQAGDLAVRASFLMSYASLRSGKPGDRDSLQRAFRMLSLAQGPDVSLPAAAALLGIGIRSAERIMERLVDTHLLQSPAQGRYRFHDLLRVYADERVRAEEDEGARSAALLRMLRWYLHTAVAACRVVSPNRRLLGLDPVPDDDRPLQFASYDEALAWLDTEHASLMICVGQAARAAEHEITWQLVFVLWDLFDLRGSFGDWLTAHETGLASTRVLGDAEAERNLLAHLAGVYRKAGRPQEALECMRDGLCISRELGVPRDIATTLVNLGFTLTDLGRTDEALEAVQEALRIFEGMGYDIGVGFTSAGVAAIHARCGRLEDALSWYQQAGQIFRKTGDIASSSETLTEIGAVYAGQGRLDEAVESATEALDLSRQCGSRHNEARALAVLGRAHRDRGEPQHARGYWLTAVAILTDLGHPQAGELAAELEALGPAAAADTGPAASRPAAD